MSKQRSSAKSRRPQPSREVDHSFHAGTALRPIAFFRSTTPPLRPVPLSPPSLRHLLPQGEKVSLTSSPQRSSTRIDLRRLMHPVLPLVQGCPGKVGAKSKCPLSRARFRRSFSVSFSRCWVPEKVRGMRFPSSVYSQIASEDDGSTPISAILSIGTPATPTIKSLRELGPYGCADLYSQFCSSPSLRGLEAGSNANSQHHFRLGSRPVDALDLVERRQRRPVARLCRNVRPQSPRYSTAVPAVKASNCCG